MIRSGWLSFSSASSLAMSMAQHSGFRGSSGLHGLGFRLWGARASDVELQSFLLPSAETSGAPGALGVRVLDASEGFRVTRLGLTVRSAVLCRLCAAAEAKADAQRQGLANCTQHKNYGPTAYNSANCEK